MNRTTRTALGSFVALGLAVACGSSSSPNGASGTSGNQDAASNDSAVGLPRVCKTPPSSPPGFPWFEEITSSVGLAPTSTLTPTASSVIAADLNGDGWSDIVTTAGNSARGASTSGALEGKPIRFLFLNQADPNNPGARIFVDATSASGLLATRDGKGDRGWAITNAGDLDDDGDVDLVLCPADELTSTYAPQDPCDAFLNDGRAHFTLAATSDLDSAVHWFPSASLLDYDQDGYLDFWPATVAHWPYDPNGPNDQPPTLYRGGGDGTFKDVSAQVGLPTKDGTVVAGTQWRHVFGVVACDIDGDGDDDMIFASYGREENQVWKNNGGTFTNVAHELGLDHDNRQDFTDDQSYRCYCQSTPSAASCSPMPPAPIVDCCGFCAEDGLACPSACAPTFRGWSPGVSDQSYNLGGNYFSFACGDMNDDGAMDLLSATITHGDVGTSSDPSELILNGGNGTFTRPGNDTTGLSRVLSTRDSVYWNRGDNMMVMVDVDLDGMKDVFSTTTSVYEISDTHRLWRQTSPGKFEEIEYQAGLLGVGDLPSLQGPAFIDIDGDGDLDLVVGEISATSTLHVFRNLVGQDQNWSRIRLVGGGAGAANTSAIGAVVKLTAGGKTQTQYVSGGYGHGNVQADLALTFGLGATCDIDSIEVHWPDAKHTVSTYTHVLANYPITITEGASDVTYATPSSVSDAGVDATTFYSGDGSVYHHDDAAASCQPASADGFTPVKVAPVKNDVCTPSQVTGAVTQCFDPSLPDSSACTTWRAVAANQACLDSCPLTSLVSTQPVTTYPPPAPEGPWGPIVEVKNPGATEFYNLGGCVQAADPSPAAQSCGDALTAQFECEYYVCAANCPVPASGSASAIQAAEQALQNCMLAADTGVCVTYATAAFACVNAIAVDAPSRFCVDGTLSSEDSASFVPGFEKFIGNQCGGAIASDAAVDGE